MENISHEFYTKLAEIGINNIDLQIDNQGTAFLSGHVEKWDTAVNIGHIAAKLQGVKNIVSNISSDDQIIPNKIDLSKFYEMDIIDKCDVAIIGGGISGCAIARQLCKYNLNILLLEKEDDISCGTTKANNGMIHSGYDPKNGSLKALLNVKGNEMYSQWEEELGFKMNRTGSFVCGFSDDDLKKIETCYENGLKNKVPGIAILDGDEARKIEKGLSDDVKYVLWTPSAAYVEPYEVALALLENAVDNGVRFRLSTKVLDIKCENNSAKFLITNKGIIETNYIINAAGLYADEIAKMADDEFYSIHPRRGTLVIFDKENMGRITTFSGMAPGPYSKGGGPMETPEGTLIWGPSAKEVSDKEDLAVDKDDLDFVVSKGMELVKGIEKSTIINYFSGNRASTYNEDFIIGNSKKINNFIHVAGIQSPGLASAPAIAEMVENLYIEKNPSTELNINYNPIRKAEKAFRDCSMEEREELIETDHRHGRIICRCETVTEAEIINAIHGKIPALSLDAVKRRTRAGMGRCQSGFCGSKVLEILSKELEISKLDVTLKGDETNILKKRTRSDFDADN